MFPTVLFKVLILLCIGFPKGGYCYCPKCNGDTNDGICTFELEDLPSCSCSECQHGASSRGNFASSQDLKVAVNYTKRTDAKAIITWALSDGDLPSGSGTLQLKIIYHFHSNVKKAQTVCLSLAKATTRVEAPLNWPPKYCRKEYINKISVTLTHVESCRQLHLTVPVHDCFETMGNQSGICGTKIPDSPESVKAVVIAQHPGTSVALVSWTPPKDGTHIAKYLVSVMSKHDDTSLTELQQLVPGNTTEYKFTLNGTYSPSSQLYAQVMAGIKSSRIILDIVCRCCEKKRESGIEYGFGPPSANADFQFPDLPLNHVDLIVWPVIGGGVLVVLIVFCTLFCISRVRRKIKHHRQNHRYTELPPTPSEVEMDDREPGTVFIVASTEEDAGMMGRIRHLCHVLGDHGLTPVHYEYVANEHNVDGPLALGMNCWVERQFSRCEFVLFVCTERFLEEWNGERRDILAPLVYPCRNLLYGSAALPQNISRYAVLFMGDRHVFPPILGCFRQFDVFQVGNEDIHADSLIHYLLEVPPFVPPRVVNFVRQIA